MKDRSIPTAEVDLIDFVVNMIGFRPNSPNNYHHDQIATS